MKKRLLALILSALLLINAVACNTVHAPENDGTGEETESFEMSDTNEDTQHATETDTSTDETSADEILRDVPGVGQLKLLRSCNISTNASLWRSDEKREYYIYINEWDAYRPLRELSSYHYWSFGDNAIAIDGETATFSMIEQDGKWDEPLLITYHFHRSNSLVELHAVPLNIKASSEYDLFLVNMLDTDHGYYFLTSRMDGDMDDRIDGIREWPLFMFETTDGGKSWNQISTNTFSPGASDYINILKFVSPQVGIISFRYIEMEDLCDRTYLTLDCGLTWTQLSHLPYPFDLNKPRTWYSEIIDFDQNDDRYYLTVEVHGTLEAVEGSDYAFPSECTEIRFSFESKDLINWSLIED